jgi:micrococcal nuclease
LLLIDAPEEHQGPFGRVAHAFLEAILPVGSKARLRLDVEHHDQYQRLLAYVYRLDGRMVNAMMVRQGFAVPYAVSPNILHIDTIRAASDSARAARMGLWALEAFDCTPDDFRRGLCQTESGIAPPTKQGLSTGTQDRGCHESYPDACIPAPPPDLDCSDVPRKRFRVMGEDPHNLDGDRDGVACEGPPAL